MALVRPRFLRNVIKRNGKHQPNIHNRLNNNEWAALRDRMFVLFETAGRRALTPFPILSFNAISCSLQYHIGIFFVYFNSRANLIRIRTSITHASFIITFLMFHQIKGATNTEIHNSKQHPLVYSAKFVIVSIQ